MFREPSKKRGGKKGKYACFECRHVFKETGKCPSCKQPMYSVGPKFRAPPKRDIKEWAIMKVWWIDQRAASGYGIWVGPGPKADTLKEQKILFMKMRKQKYDHKIEDAWRMHLAPGHGFPYVKFK